MIIKITPDKEKTKSMLRIILMRVEFLKTIDKKRFPTIILETYYEILKELTSCLIMINGFKTSGEYAHKEMFQKLLELKQITYEDFILADNLRIKRNNSSYDGIETNIDFLNDEDRIKKLIEKLQKKIETGLKRL